VKSNYSVSKENFDSLLNWLSTDRDEAGSRFEQIREGLIRYFRLKGCHEPEVLADESMNRVTARIDSLDLTTGAKPISVFYGFAAQVFLEYSRSDNRRIVQLIDSFDKASGESIEIAVNDGLDCLRKCLNSLAISDGKLIVEYYSEEKQAKFELRRKLAIQNEMAIGTLQTKIHRIKRVLRPCVEKCMTGENV
jgi:hypothetical protein